jgi:hypothetical protein
MGGRKLGSDGILRAGAVVIYRFIFVARGVKGLRGGEENGNSERETGNLDSALSERRNDSA